MLRAQALQAEERYISERPYEHSGRVKVRVGGMRMAYLMMVLFHISLSRWVHHVDGIQVFLLLTRPMYQYLNEI